MEVDARIDWSAIHRDFLARYEAEFERATLDTALAMVADLIAQDSLRQDVADQDGGHVVSRPEGPPRF